MDLVEIERRTLRRIVVAARNWICTIESTGIGDGDPRAAAVDEEVADPDRRLDVVVALVTAVGGDLVTVIPCTKDTQC